MTKEKDSVLSFEQSLLKEISFQIEQNQQQVVIQANSALTLLGYRQSD